MLTHRQVNDFASLVHEYIDTAIKTKVQMSGDFGEISKTMHTERQRADSADTRYEKLKEDHERLAKELATSRREVGDLRALIDERDRELESMRERLALAEKLQKECDIERERHSETASALGHVTRQRDQLKAQLDGQTTLHRKAIAERDEAREAWEQVRNLKAKLAAAIASHNLIERQLVGRDGVINEIDKHRQTLQKKLITAEDALDKFQSAVADQAIQIMELRGERHINRIEVQSDDPDRMVFGLIEFFRDAAKNPSSKPAAVRQDDGEIGG